jgi:hypothetical protein
MAIELKRFFNTVIKTTSAHNLTTGAVVRITRTDNNLNGNNYYVKVLSSTSFSLYYDSSLTKIVGTNSLNITSSATIIPLFVTSLTYTYGFPGSGGGGSSTSTTTFAFSTSITTNIQNFNLSSALVAAGWNQTSAVVATISIDAGIYIWSDSTSLAALTVTSLPASSTVSILNNGYIMGKGGWGGDAPVANGGVGVSGVAGGTGGPAMSLGYNISLTNNSYIAGGGGGGGSGTAGGGGGAGGGASANRISTGIGTVVAGGAPGAVGNVGTSFGAAGGGGNPFNQMTGAGASGGRIIPGTGGAGGIGTFSAVAAQGKADGAGGGGGGFLYVNALGADESFNGGAGGSANSAGSNQVTVRGSGSGGGGGGGWGAAGGNNRTGSNVGGSGGKAINLNGYSVTYIVTGTLYGAVS